MSSGPPHAVDRGGGLATTLLFGFTVGVLGLLGSLPPTVGLPTGVAGVAIAAVLRARRSPAVGSWALLPALGAIAVLAATSPAEPASELFAGLAGLSFLLWIADDPERPAGGGRRAVPTIALGALGVGLAWSITLALPGRSPDVGLAGGLLAAALVLLALLVARLPRTALGPVRNA